MKKTLLIFLVVVVVGSSISVKARAEVIVDSTEILQLQYQALLLQLIQLLTEQINSLMSQLAILQASGPAPLPPITSPTTLLTPALGGGSQLASVDPPVIKLLFDTIDTERAIVESGMTPHRIEWLATQENKDPVGCEASGPILSGKMGSQGVAMRILSEPGMYLVNFICVDRISNVSSSNTLTIEVR